eukprot:5889400-Pyramimonas_sp.AAC.1
MKGPRSVRSFGCRRTHGNPEYGDGVGKLGFVLRCPRTNAGMIALVEGCLVVLDVFLVPGLLVLVVVLALEVHGWAVVMLHAD